MPITRIKNYIKHLRRQPEPARLRAVSLMTAGSGMALLVLWVTVLLPLQLKLTGGQPQATPATRLIGAATPVPTSTLDTRIGGIQTTPLLASPTPSDASLPAALPVQITGTISPTPSGF